MNDEVAPPTSRRNARDPVGKPKTRKKKSIPINAQVFATLRRRIISGKYARTGSLPPELTLMREFDVSRHTIRTALHKLVIDGLIERRRGTRTTIVRRGFSQGSWSVGSLEAMFGDFYAADDLSVGPVPAKQFPKEASLLGIGKDGSLFRAVRVMRTAAGPQSYSTVFTRPEFGAMVPRNLLASQFFLTLIEEYCGLRATRARQVASAALPPPPACRILELDPGQPTVALERTFFTRSGEPIAHIHLYCHPRHYPLVTDFYREHDAEGR
jgi:GntR family transcriptional regulator